jgi:cytoskeletal protein RodZ
VLPNTVDKLSPPAELDERVLDAAREAIQAPRQANPGRPARWAVPVALAATILLCLSVVLNVALNRGRTDGGEQRLAADDQQGGVGMSSRQVGGMSRAASPASSARAESAVPPVAGPTPAAPLTAPTPAAAAATALAARSAASAEVPKAAGAARAAPAAEAPSTADGARAAPAAADAATRDAPAGVPAAGVPAKADAAARVPAHPHPRDPRVWLRQIAALRAQGKTAQADAEMQRFHVAFPSYRLRGSAAPTQ